MTEPLIELMVKIVDHIPEETDYALSVLKGHLIIEEELNNALVSKVSHPTHLKNSRLSFKQLSVIVKAHYWTKENSWCWEAIDKINKIRNSLSHKLEPENFENNLVEFIKLVELRQKPSEETDLSERLRYALAMVAARIHGL